MPTSMQSIDPEFQIAQLSRALTQAQQDEAHFKHEIENDQRIVDLSTFELGESKRTVENLNPRGKYLESKPQKRGICEKSRGT